MKNKENLTWFYNRYGSGFLNIISQDLCEKTPLLKNSQDKQEKYIAVFKNLQQELCQVSDFWFLRIIRKYESSRENLVSAFIDSSATLFGRNHATF